MSKVHFYCQNCGNETPKWHGRCPICKEWNTISEEIKTKKSKNKLFDIPINVKTPTPIQNVVHNTSIQSSTLDSELDTVLGGGIVAGSIILLAGEPGIGKSTLLLQMALLIFMCILGNQALNIKNQFQLVQNLLFLEVLLESVQCQIQTR